MKKLSGLLVVVCFCTISSAQLSMKKADGGILIVDGEKNVLQFQAEPKDKDGKYSRCNYIHPLWGMDGQVLTEDFPTDHLHHRGVFWAWHQVWIGDKRIGDPWELKDLEQNVVELEFVKNSSGSVQIKTEVDWKSNKWKKNGQKVPYIKEYTNITVNPRESNYRKIDFEIKLLAMAEGVKIGGSEDKKGYSGFSLRMVLPEDVTFSGVNGEIIPEVTAINSSGYVNIRGSVGEMGNRGGILILDNPENPNYPQPWILRKKNSMQNAVFPGRGAVPVSTSEPLVLKYSLVVYAGKLNDKKIKKLIN